MMSFRLPIAAAAMSFMMAGAAFAQNAYTTGNVNMRAGPGVEYPRVTVIPAGSGVEVFGCLSGWNWCDTGWRGARGWVSASYLQMVYQGRRVRGPEYLPRMGVPIITFQFGNYWDRYYRDRSWFHERDRWDRPNRPRPPVSRPTPSEPSQPPYVRPDRPRPPVVRPTPSEPSRPPIVRPDRPRPPVAGPRPSEPSQPPIVRPERPQPPVMRPDRPQRPELRPDVSRPPVMRPRPDRGPGEMQRPSQGQRPSREAEPRRGDGSRSLAPCPDGRNRPGQCL